jgi:hypothetical protein
MIYRWKNQSLGQVPAQIVGEEIQRITVQNGGCIKPHNIVAHAQAVTSPIHRCFEWNNKLAAEKYRIEQAKYMLRSIVVVQQVPDDEPLLVRAFVSIKKNDEPVYTSIHRAVNDPEQWEFVLASAYEELKAWRQKYKDLQQFANIFDLIDLIKI